MKYFCFILLLLLVSCASKPVLYPNKKYKSVGKEAASKDIETCMADADQFIDSPRGKKILKSAGKGSILGGAIGAISGLLTGDIGGSIVSGAAIGATAGGVGEAISPDDLKRAYVNRCLKEKRYEVIGWD